MFLLSDYDFLRCLCKWTEQCCLVCNCRTVLILLNIMSLGLLILVTWNRIFFLLLRMQNIPSYVHIAFSLFISWQTLSLLLPLGYHEFCKYLLSIPLDRRPKVGLLDHMVILVLIIWGTPTWVWLKISVTEVLPLLKLPSFLSHTFWISGVDVLPLFSGISESNLHCDPCKLCCS